MTKMPAAILRDQYFTYTKHLKRRYKLLRFLKTLSLYVNRRNIVIKDNRQLLFPGTSQLHSFLI